MECMLKKTIGFLIGFLLLCPWVTEGKAAELDELMAKISFSKSDAQQVLDGKLMTASLTSASDRELAVALVVKVELPPRVVVQKLLAGVVIEKDKRVFSYGELPKPMTTEALNSLVLRKSQLARWRGAKAGEGINLSKDEIEQVRSQLAEGSAEVASASQVGEVVRQILVSRIRSYQQSGLNGISPYQRSDDDVRKGGEELRIATHASAKFNLFSSDVYDVLLAYPDRTPPGFEENFFWAIEKGSDSSLISLTHRFSMPDGEGYATVQRQFYVSDGYNVEQALARVIPVEGGSVVIYTNRTSTDQVDGFGGSARRRIGDSLMLRQLKKLYQTIAQDLTEDAESATP